MLNKLLEKYNEDTKYLKSGLYVDDYNDLCLNYSFYIWFRKQYFIFNKKINGLDYEEY